MKPLYGHFTVPESDLARSSIEAPAWPSRKLQAPPLVLIPIQQLSPETLAEIAAVKHRLSTLKHTD